LTGQRDYWLSVIITSVNGLPILKECLDSLAGQEEAGAFEVIVADRCLGETGAMLTKKFPFVKVIEAPFQTPIPQLRALGVRNSSGEIVAVLEDHCLAAPDWAKHMREAHRFPYPVVGGSIENAACRRLVDWAAFFCEYHRVARPVAEGETGFVSGNNVSYKRRVLGEFLPDLEAGTWDFIIHERLKNAGHLLYLNPSILVYHKMSASLRWFLIQKYHFARSLAGTRAARMSWPARAALGGGAALLPLVQLVRILTTTWKKKRYRPRLLASLPFLIMLVLGGAAGEFAGSLTGSGSSASKVA